MKFFKSCVISAAILLGGAPVMAQIDPPPLSPDIFEKYMSYVEFPVEKSFHYFVMNAQSYEGSLRANDLSLLNNEAKNEHNLMLRELKDRAKVFKLACQNLDQFSHDTQAAKAQLMLEAFERADKLSIKLYTDRYKTAMAELSAAGQKVFNSELPELSKSGYTSVMNWRAMAQNDFAALNAMFDMSCKSLADVDESSEFEAIVKRTESDPDNRQDGDGLSNTFTTLQLKAKENEQ